MVTYCNFVQFFTICMMKLLSIISRMCIQGIPGRLSLRGLESRLTYKTHYILCCLPQLYCMHVRTCRDHCQCFAHSGFLGPSFSTTNLIHYTPLVYKTMKCCGRISESVLYSTSHYMYLSGECTAWNRSIE